MSADSRSNQSADGLDTGKHADETDVIRDLLKKPALNAAARAKTVAAARQIVLNARAGARPKGVIETFLEEFGLSNTEGLALMCLAEALLRVPDDETRDKLIAEKIRSGDWGVHKGQSDSTLVNASTWGLMLTGRIVRPPMDAMDDPSGFMMRMVRQMGEPVIQAAMMQAMRIMGEQFVLGRNIKDALRRGDKLVRKNDGANFSFDMLGEGARTHEDAERYFKAYQAALEEVGRNAKGRGPEIENGISVKLSALHPAYHAVHEDRIHDELYPKFLSLAEQAADKGVNLCMDAEEADRLVLSLNLFARLSDEPSLKGWTGLGLALQAYQLRAGQVVDWLSQLAQSKQRRFMVRLVKGAYWDSEIKHAQVGGMEGYPVFTTKPATDVSYLSCARALIDAGSHIYPQFATHNAHTVAAIDAMVQDAGRSDYEFQRLHGMGEALYAAAGRGDKVRVYAPVGEHEDLLPYLVRRLLENGANTSFVHSFMDEDVPADDIVADPFAALEAHPHGHPRIPRPPQIYGAERRNSAGFDLTQRANHEKITRLVKGIEQGALMEGGSIISGDVQQGRTVEVRPPQTPDKPIGVAHYADASHVETAFNAAAAFQPSWNRLGGSARAEILRNMADEMEADMPRLIALMALEAGKTLQDGVDEVREAVDFCRYYAAEADAKFGAPELLPGPVGETNHLELNGRGVFVCISPWNFPLAIFTGQLAAALAAGNTVVAKPAEQTPLIAFEAVKLFQKAGLPADALHLLLGDGEIGAILTAHKTTAGVAFTGSTAVSRIINRTLAEKDGPIVPLIAETGGLNAMFVDTTALAEQVVDDVIRSAFGSAGQRCSALRILFLPEETADYILTMLEGAMKATVIGDPGEAHTDIGPLIDDDAMETLNAHLLWMNSEGTSLNQPAPPLSADNKGRFFNPAIVELDSLEKIKTEVFGPFLHVIRYKNADLERLGAELTAKGYGLTLGVHSRLERFAGRVQRAVKAGNVYVNRSMTGAVVGVQPFGGLGLSGTGPKAGGPNYLQRFATERAVSVDITAQGGDPALLNLG